MSAFPRDTPRPGRTSWTTAMRETREETGLVHSAAQPVGFSARTVRYEAFGKSKEVVVLRLARACDSGTSRHARPPSTVSTAWLNLRRHGRKTRSGTRRSATSCATPRPTWIKDPILRLRPDPARRRENAVASRTRRSRTRAVRRATPTQVAGMARTCAEAWGGIDAEYVEAAAWLHDIGRGKTHGIAPSASRASASPSKLPGIPGYAPPCLSPLHEGPHRRRSSGSRGRPRARDEREACDLATFPVEECASSRWRT